MFINDNIGALNAWRNLTSNQSSMTQALQRLSSGLRINSAADDAAGLAISQKMDAQVKGLQQAQQNAQNGQSLLQIAEGAFGQTQNILQRMRQLSVEAASDTATSTDRTNIGTEITALTAEIDQIASTTQYNGQNLLDGTGGTTGTFTFQVGANTSQNVAVTIAKGDSTTLAVAGVKVDTQANANTAIATIDAAIGTVSTNRASLGANMNRLQYAADNLSLSAQNMTDARSRITDVDMASEMATFTKYQILQQAGVSMMAQANSMPQSVLKLLG